MPNIKLNNFIISNKYLSYETDLCYEKFTKLVELNDEIITMDYLNDAYKGKTPTTIRELTIGDYNVTVSSENYHDKTERVMVEYDRKNSKNFILQPKPGTVTIIISPPETKISVGDKQYKVDTDGIASIELPVGQHKIDFRLKGYEPVTKNVTVLANEKKSLEIQLYLSKTTHQQVMQQSGDDGPWILWYPNGD